MSETIINSAVIRTQAETLSNLNVQFQSQVNQLRNLEASLNSSWDGDARRAFHNAFESDMVQMDNFYKAINTYVSALMNAAARYEEAERNNVDIATTRSY